VISGSSVIQYRGKVVDPRTLGRELNVRAVLTGKYMEREVIC
jgi:TolB-like protein